MNTGEFLFPTSLQRTPTPLRKMLLIGSCLSEAYQHFFSQRENAPEIDFILFNNIGTLPHKNADEITSYDLQYIQLPLRSVLTDAVVRVFDTDLTRSHDWISIGCANIDLMLDSAIEYNTKAGLLTLVATFVVPQGRAAPSLQDCGGELDFVYIVQELNRHIYRTVKKYDNVYVADVDYVANSAGKRYFLDDIIYFYSHGSLLNPFWAVAETDAHWTAPEPGRIEAIPDLGQTYEMRVGDFVDATYRQIEAIYRIAQQVDMVKVVIFDLDNTLWRGQIAEHYLPGASWPHLDGWPVGLWETVQHLRRRGIVVAIVSKNDESVVISKWQDAVGLPFVKLDDFVLKQINWKPKAENIENILSQLSLTAKSAVFVDDNPVERESVVAAHPEIRVIGSDPFIVRRTLLWAPETQIPRRTTESSNRENMLKKQTERESEKASMTREKFLSTLDSRLVLFELRNTSDQRFSRVSELVNKTNQFNTTGRRWKSEDYVRFFAESGRLFAFSVSDRFTEYGIVGVIFYRDFVIEQFVMSCRVLGLDIEIAALKTIVGLTQMNPISDVYGTMINTESNMPVRSFFERGGFCKTEEDSLYVLRRGQSVIDVPYVTVVSEGVAI